LQYSVEVQNCIPLLSTEEANYGTPDTFRNAVNSTAFSCLSHAVQAKK